MAEFEILMQKQSEESKFGLFYLFPFKPDIEIPKNEILATLGSGICISY